MRRADDRLGRLFSALTAKERAILILRQFKENKKEDPHISGMAPPRQVRELTFYLLLVQSVNLALGSYVLFLEQQVIHLDLLFANLSTYRLRVAHALALAEYIAICTNEPISESAYGKLRERAKSKRGPLRPYWGRGYDVLPDEKADEVRRLRQARRQVKQTLQDLPISLILNPPLRTPSAKQPMDVPSSEDDIVRGMLATLQQETQSLWRHFGAVESLIEEVAAKLDGEDPLHPDTRSVLNQCKERLRRLHREVQKYVGPFDLPEPEGDELEEITRDIDKMEKWCLRS